MLILTHQQHTAFENTVRKGEIARNEQFLLFPQCFQLNQITVSPFVHISDITSLFAVESEEPKTGPSGKGLTRLVQIKLRRILLSDQNSTPSDIYWDMLPITALKVRKSSLSSFVKMSLSFI